jgi:hypothetical protein
MSADISDENSTKHILNHVLAVMSTFAEMLINDLDVFFFSIFYILSGHGNNHV